ncbi:hypothetical protein GQ457_07G014760 [Hibiscus cannabinus]
MLHCLRKRHPLLHHPGLRFLLYFHAAILDHPCHLKVHATKNVRSWGSCVESQFKDLRTSCCFRNYASQMGGSGNASSKGGD